MAINGFFILLYVILSGNLPAEVLYYLAIVQSVVGIYSIYSKEQQPVNPLFVYYFSMIFASLSNISLIAIVGTSENTVYRYIVPEYIDEATKITCIGNSCILIGFDMFKQIKLPSLAAIVKNESIYKYLYYFLIVFTVSLFFGYGAIFNLLKVFDNIIKLIFLSLIIIFVRIWQFEKNIKYRNFAVICVIVETINALFHAYLREELIVPMLCFYIGYVISAGFDNLFTAKTLAPVIIVLTIYFSLFGKLEKSRSHFIDAFLPGNEVEYNQVNMGGTTERSGGGLLIRSANLAQVTSCVKLVEKNGFYDGKVSYPLLVALIPRDLYPDKPNVGLGIWFAIEIGVAIKSELSTEKALMGNNSINMTIPGELYLDFGYLGVFIGCILSGAFIMLLWNACEFYKSPYNLTGTLFGGYLLFSTFLGIGADLQIIVTFLSMYLTMYIIKRLL